MKKSKELLNTLKSIDGTLKRIEQLMIKEDKNVTISGDAIAEAIKEHRFPGFDLH